jgi:hypothetical protein
MPIITIEPRVRRTLAEALTLAGLPRPRRAREIGELYLQLLVQGVDHEHVGSATWLTRILASAPDRRDPDMISRDWKGD